MKCKKRVREVGIVKIFCIIMVLMTVIAANGGFTYAAAGGSSSTTFAPSFLVDVPYEVLLKPGQTTEFQISAKNISNYNAKDVMIEAEFIGVAGEYLNFLSDNSVDIGSIEKGETADATIEVTANDLIKIGIYQISITVSYKDIYYSNPYSDSKTINVKITEQKSQPVFNASVVFDTNRLKAGGDYDIAIKLKNIGGTSAYNIAVQLAGFSSSGLSLVGDSGERTLSTVAPDEIAELKYRVHVSENINTEVAQLTLNLTYEDGQGKNASQQSSLFIPVEIIEEDEEDDNTTTKIVVGQYRVTPSIVEAGETCSLEIEFWNTSLTKKVVNIKASLLDNTSSNGAGNVFSPVNASNTFYIAEIGKNRKVMESIELYTENDAPAKTYSINLSIEYQDEDGKAYTVTESINIPVKQVTRIETSDTTVNGSLEAEKQLSVATDILNIGRTTVKNVRINVEGSNFEKKETSSFIGSFAPGSSSYYEAIIVAEQAGTVNGEIIITFEDADGEEHQVRKPFEIQGIKAASSSSSATESISSSTEVFSNTSGSSGADSGGISTWLILIFAVIGLGLVVIVIVASSKEKKKKELMIDEDI